MKMGAELVWMLNNDAVVPPDTAAKLVDKAMQNPKAGIVGAVLYYMHDQRRVQAWGGGSINLWTGYSKHFVAPESFGPNSYVTFASALIRREVFDELGGVYEGAFMYFEDTDFGLRTHRAGWELCVAEGTEILHKVGGSFEEKCNPALERIVTMSGLSFLNRHAVVRPVAIALFLCLKIGKRVLLRDWGALGAVLLGARDWWMKKPATLE
jgi:GT2 family glycosyltransferase